jgi:hypothetical protein
MMEADREQAAFAKIKEIKLQLPLRTHVNLHSMKLLHNQSIRDSVVAALERYFRANPVDGGGPMAAG